ncbi:MAG TPA: hypothetical protein VGN72_02350 [Tepidisphaeraceae bacterium]|jgi:hypothetical protein|nr:hypothetical protein [Tepidisphaeraceae bacterium]
MADVSLQSLCELGQAQLVETQYLTSIATFVQAERIAWESGDLETLSRLYFPLQEARRQARQRCGEGIVKLDLIASGPNDASIDADRIVGQCPHGQLLVAGWGSIRPAMDVRNLAMARGLYLETFLGAVYPITGGGRAVAIVPLDDAKLPEPTERSIDALLPLLPPHSMVLPASQLPAGERRGTTQTFAETMAMWEQLHAPFLAAADASVDLLQRMQGYRKTLRVDGGCELAHQRLAITARELDRTRRSQQASRHVPFDAD